MHRCYSAVLAALGCAALAAFPAFAGSGNIIYLKQDSTLGGTGNTIYVDQSGATNSQVGGIDQVTSATDDNSITFHKASNPAEYPALQEGSGNSASLTIRDDASHMGGGVAYLLQNNSASDALGLGNSALMSLTGPVFGAIAQEGSGNIANLSVSGTGTNGAIFQKGNQNNGKLTASGGGNIALIQNGNNLQSDLTVTAANGSSVTYQTNGVNGAGTPASVITNAANVTITQTSTFAH
jgi:hypothetical protein